MRPTIPKKLQYVKYWEYQPSNSLRTKPRRVTSRKVLSSIESALQEHMTHLTMFAEDPAEDRYVVLMYPGNRKRIHVKVLGSVVVIDDECYISKKASLKTVMDSLPRTEAEKLVHCPDLSLK